MKHIAILLAFLGLSLGILPAQTVPLFINYQGIITGGDETPLGSTGSAPNFLAAPINRKVIFRIYDAQSGGVLLWSEEQTVTISLGEFSILLGQGINAVYDGVAEPRPGLDTVFIMGSGGNPDGPGRFLELVVDDGNGTFTAADTPVSPRQRVTTSAYSFRAGMADSVPDGAIGSAALAAGSITSVKIQVGAVNSAQIANSAIAGNHLANGAVTSIKIAGNAVTGDKIPDGAIGSADLANSAVTASKIAANAVDSSKIVNGSVTTIDLANGAVTTSKLDPSIGFWTANGGDVHRATGNVGIGTAGPSAKLQVAGKLRIDGNNQLELGGGIVGKEPNAGTIGYEKFTAGSLDIVGAGTSGANRKVKFWAEGGTTFTGRLGIGTDSPTVPLHVASATSLSMVDNHFNSNGGQLDLIGGQWIWNMDDLFDLSSGTDWFGPGGYHNFLDPDARVVAPVGILSDNWIASAKGFIAYSDRRIKRDIHASATARDLAAIEALQVTDYRMVDPADGGTAWRKGFVAQEVEKVIPGAVSRSVEFVPDIFSLAVELDYRPVARTLLITLKKDHGLKPGDRVRLHVDGRRLDLDVSAVPSGRELVVANFESAPKQVLVYGRQVDDFRTVDYDRIFTTSVGALQELKREKDAEVEALQNESESLRVRLAALEAKEHACEARLAAIEKLLTPAERAETRAVSLRSGE